VEGAIDGIHPKNWLIAAAQPSNLPKLKYFIWFWLGKFFFPAKNIHFVSKLADYEK